ncbi:MAG: phenylalanine--tRNA ligase subunit alpha [Syntrophaceticus sp.]|nr:phenylalanine--tRNA ligase subunit alpha [Syntrophaceticus sp.]MDD3314660.1 phenylalanine--tRNA ligase subunit alpha [Syntrophaceticus sp.]MDD4359889.1 phenylalanine--tRNA ligase subunit alpha [Syntrophaceticus sp.]
MEQEIQRIKDSALADLQDVETEEELQELRVKYLGKKGMLTKVLRGMGKVPAEMRPQLGQLANEVRQLLEGELDKRLAVLQEKEKERKIAKEAIDVTLPGRPAAGGHKHPLTIVLQEIKDIFTTIGFEVAEGPEIEYDYYNFESLNIPKGHPARDMQDSFYITDEVLLRTHTSPVQIRVLEERVPDLPVRIIAPGKVYRRDDDATHSPMFHQVEGLLVDDHCTLGDLKGVLLAFVRRMFGQDREIRLRPSYFPFTEPSAEVDVSCINCKGKGCRVCSGTGWLEVLGCGMVHPKVLAGSGYDPEEVIGFAFGMGVERIAMLKYGINDLRLFFDNDIRFLRQF